MREVPDNLGASSMTIGHWRAPRAQPVAPPGDTPNTHRLRALFVSRPSIANADRADADGSSRLSPFP